MCDSFHISIVLVTKEIHFFWGSYWNSPLCWQWHPTSLTLISPCVLTKVIKENPKLDLPLESSSSQAPCCLAFFPLIRLVAVFPSHSCLPTSYYFLNWQMVSNGNALLKSSCRRLSFFCLCLKHGLSFHVSLENSLNFSPFCLYVHVTC